MKNNKDDIWYAALQAWKRKGENTDKGKNELI